MRTKLAFIAAACCLCFAATAPAQVDRDQTALMRRQAIEWFKAINVQGPEGRMVPGVTDSIIDMLSEGRHLIILVPSELSKDGKAYYGLTWAGLFHAFEVNAEQARHLEMTDGVTTGTGQRRDDLRRSEPVGQLDHLRVDGGNRVSGDQAITGTVDCRMFGELPAGKLVLRVMYKRSGSTVTVTHPVREIPANGVLKFRLDKVNDAGDEIHRGALPLFADLCLEQGSGSSRQMIVVSNTLSTLLDVSAGAPAAGSVAGTTWRFGGSDSTVTFLPSGNMQFSDSIFGGKWEQNGDQVKFDSNNFTLFEVTVRGNEMTGAWRRLQGDDVGLRSPTSLTRVGSIR